MLDIPTICQCVGGCADGVELQPPDPDEPHDWPDEITLVMRGTGVRGDYRFRNKPPQIIKGRRVYFYDVAR